MAINHLEGHLLTCRLCYDVEFPFLLLLTSGGNFLFAEVLGIGKYKILGETLDDAAGECTAFRFSAFCGGGGRVFFGMRP